MFVYMDPVILILVLVIGFTVLGILIARGQKPPQELLDIIKMLKDSSDSDRKVLLDSLHQNTQNLNLRLDNAAKVINDVQKSVGEMSEIGRGMKDLQDFLRSPKLRGNIGEQILNELLGQMLPKSSFHLQYAFKSGEKVDAAIKTSAGIIP